MATSNSVQIEAMEYTPKTIEIAVGDVVVWTNDDGFAHTVTADDGTFDSGDIEGGQTFAFTFNEAGTFAYHCDIHPDMVGRVTVK